MAEPVRRPRVLYVDDDVNVLNAVRRQQGRNLDLTVFTSPFDALEKIENGESFEVVVSDLRMPCMDGIEFLRRVEQVNADTSRIMLTGNADLEAAKRAVNDGRIFRFLTKPCPSEDLREAIVSGAKLYNLVVAERDLLQRTLRGAVEVLTETLGLVNPVAFGLASRIRRHVHGLVEQMGFSEAWRYDVAAMLSQIGCVTVPSHVVEKAYLGETLETEERDMVSSHPGTGRDLIRGIPRLEGVAEMIGFQTARFDGEGSAPGTPVGEQIPVGARLLKVALDFDEQLSRGEDRRSAAGKLAEDPGPYDPNLLEALTVISRLERRHVAREVRLAELSEGMTVAEDVSSESGLLLVASGQQVTVLMMKRIDNWIATRAHVIREPIRVLVPTDEQCGEDSGA